MKKLDINKILEKAKTAKILSINGERIEYPELNKEDCYITKSQYKVMVNHNEEEDKNECDD